MECSITANTNISTTTLHIYLQQHSNDYTPTISTAHH